MVTIVERSTDAALESIPAAPTDWCAIAGGAAIAVAISVTLLTFGAAIGLTLAPKLSSSSAAGAAIAVGLWLVFVQVTGFLGGGYVAGRLRRRTRTATPHETEVRDGMHGLIVWAVSTIVVAAGTSLAAAFGTLAGTAVVSSAAANGSLPYYADVLLRPEAAAQSNAAASGSTGTTAQPSAAPAPAEVRAEISRIFARNLTGSIDPLDRAYLGQIVARSTGMSEDKALARVDDTLAKARAATEAARKTGILYAFLTAASLLVGALAAGWAAMRGGFHRDQGTDFSLLVRWT